ncbi:hypothetical protein AX17_005664 [Amanita inopinata Kibby_2008]|nr:hypothetical protein AX17_005664 [Amanita inopinata Kibby_2008]
MEAVQGTAASELPSAGSGGRRHFQGRSKDTKGPSDRGSSSRADDGGGAPTENTTERGENRRGGRRRGKPFSKDSRTGSNEKDEGASPSTTSRTGTPVSAEAPIERGQAHQAKPRLGYRARAAKFNPGLTAPNAEAVPEQPSSSRPATPPVDSGQVRPSEKYKRRSKPTRPSAVRPQAGDLTSTLIRSLSTRPYPDCPICFSPIHPLQPIWSCSPSIPQVLSPEEDESTPTPQYCWTTFHVKCIGSWASKSVKTLEEAWRARGEMNKKGEWRCPGCQAKREIVPAGYWCFCNSIPDPKPSRIATPHSCGNSCSRPRESGCGHPCPLLCHPGPCPPCQITTQIPCPCPRHKLIAFRCGEEHMSLKGKGKDSEKISTGTVAVSCGDICGRVLDCGKHTCSRICHADECGVCEVREEARCYCGRISKETRCGEGKAITCSVRNVGENRLESWVGRFECERICDRPFDCGAHLCQKQCHPPSTEPAQCPFSPRKVTHCPCGKHAIAPPDTGTLVPSASSTLQSSSSTIGDIQFTFPARVTCTAPIPTCNSPCGKILTSCGHPCAEKCHLGACPPCGVPLVRPCRCGYTSREIKCGEFNAIEGEKEIFCDRPCTALRACGRHECRRVCCPLASLSFGSASGGGTGGKGKKGRAVGIEDLRSTGIGEEEGGLHECDLVCGRMLTCGNHRCERKDHKGPCPSCLRSSFEEMVCFCGRTVIEPPIPCGTKIVCNYQCPRPPPPCGHPRTPHTCHEDPVPCPPCAFLAKKPCACGKKEVDNVRCSLEREKVSCGVTCGKLMSCGFHHCQRLCHAGECGRCTAQCGKDRKLCLPAHHPCTRPCHAPSICPEDEPCQSFITISCPCGRMKQSVRCGRCESRPSGSQSQSLLKCTSQCEIAKRNARLADALGITAETRERAGKGMAGGQVVYPEEVVAFAKANWKFVPLVEKALADFVTSDKKTQVLPHMPLDRRKFVQSLAGIYRIDVQIVDQEPRRSVQLLRRLDTRTPTPLLSAHITSSMPAARNLGKLVDLKSLSSAGASSSSRRAPPKTGSPPPISGIAASGVRGWGTGVGGTSSTPAPASALASSAASTGSRVPSRSSTPKVGDPAAIIKGPVDVGDEEIPDNWEDV